MPSETVCGVPPAIVAPQTVSANPAAARPAKVVTRPATLAIAPTAGPSRQPAIAAETAPPITSPRRAAGAVATSQARPPVQASAQPHPCAVRATKMVAASGATPNNTLAADSSARPLSAVALTPIRVTSSPLGTAATSAPAAYVPVSTPASVTERWKRSV